MKKEAVVKITAAGSPTTAAKFVAADRTTTESPLVLPRHPGAYTVWVSDRMTFPAPETGTLGSCQACLNKACCCPPPGCWNLASAASLLAVDVVMPAPGKGVCSYIEAFAAFAATSGWTEDTDCSLGVEAWRQKRLNMITVS